MLKMKNSYNSIVKNPNNLIKNGQMIWIDIFQRRHTDGQYVHEKILTSIITREMKIKTTMRDPLTPVRISSVVAHSCPTLCDPVNCSTLGLPVHHQLPEFTHTHVHWVNDAIQPSHPLVQHYGKQYRWASKN